MPGFGSVSVVRSGERKDKDTRAAENWMGQGGDLGSVLSGVCGSGDGAPQKSRLDRALESRHGERRRERSAADLLSTGLGTRFKTGSKEAKEKDGLSQGSGNMPLPVRGAPDGSTPVSQLVDAEGYWQGNYIPEHLRCKSAAELEEMLAGAARQSRGRGKNKRGADEDDGDGLDISQLLRAEKLRRLTGKRSTSDRGGALVHGSDQFAREHLVALGEHVGLMLPLHGALLLGHCYLFSLEPRSSELQYDEHMLREVRNYKKCLLQMYAAHGQEAVFCEICTKPQSGQTFIECVPVPEEMAGDLDIAVWKSLDECENEFAQTHKRVINTKEKPLSSCIASGVPYLHVSFGLGGGYAHAIADPSSFPRDFLRRLLGGFMGVGMSGRLSRQESDALLGPEGVRKFRAIWNSYDWTRQLDAGSDEDAVQQQQPQAAAAPQQPAQQQQKRQQQQQQPKRRPPPRADGEIDIGI